MNVLNIAPTSNLASDIYVGVVGLVIELSVFEGVAVKDLSSASNMTFTFKRPDGSIFIRNVMPSTDGKDGKLSYSTVAGDITVSGTWQVQVGITLGAFTGKSSIASFDVNDVLQ